MQLVFKIKLIIFFILAIRCDCGERRARRPQQRGRFRFEHTRRDPAAPNSVYVHMCVCLCMHDYHRTQVSYSHSKYSRMEGIIKILKKRKG